MTKFTVIAAAAAAGFAVVADAAEFEMKIGLTAPVNTQHYSYMPWAILEQEIEARTGGRVDVQLFPGGQLGGLSSLAQQVRQGVIEAAMVSDGTLATTYPPIQVFSLPYLFKNREIAWSVIEGEFGEAMIEDMAEKVGVRPYGIMENGGFRHISNSVREVRSPADLEGLKIRVPENPLAIDMIRNLGASPTPIPWADLYTALQTGVADGQENPVATFLRPKLEEVQSHMTLNGHSYGTMMLIMNEDWWSSLPEDIRAAFDQARPIVAAAAKGLILADEVRGLQYLDEQGVQVYAPTASEWAEFQALTREPGLEWLKAEIGAEWVDRVVEAVAEAEAHHGYTQ